MADARFFKNIPEKNIARSASHPIEVRGDFFRALAVTIMDNLKNGVRLPDASLQKVLEYFTRYFPEVKKNHTYLSLEPDTTDGLAIVLRQLAIDEALANPARYQELFVGLPPEMTKESLRQGSVALHSCALAAVAHALNITVTLSIKDMEKELRARQVLNQQECSSHFNVTLQVQGDMYLPCVKYQGYFQAVGQLSMSAPQPTLPAGTETLAETFAAITQSNEALWQTYERYRKMLASAIDTDGLTQQSLVQLYARFLPEESSNRLFSALEQQYNKTIVNGVRDNLTQQKTKMLINALAGSLSIGYIDEELLFDAMEQPSMRRASSLQ